MTLPVLIFDLDGTLTDSREGITRCFVHALEQAGVEVPETAELERWIGAPLWDAFAAVLSPQERVALAVRCFRERYATVGMYENSLYPGIEEALRALQERSEAMFVATSKPTEYADRIIDHFGLRRYFRHVYGSELSGERADKSVLLAHVLERESLAGNGVVMIGDRKHDIIAARTNGVSSLGVAWGFGSLEELREAGADRICGSVPELVGMLG